MTMKNNLFLLLPLVVVLAGCATQENACEDITLASEQIQECQSLQRQIANARGKPIIRTELERRYQTDCSDVRYYRDAQQIAICGNKEKMGKIQQQAIDKKE